MIRVTLLSWVAGLGLARGGGPRHRTAIAATLRTPPTVARGISARAAAVGTRRSAFSQSSVSQRPTGSCGRPPRNANPSAVPSACPVCSQSLGDLLLLSPMVAICGARTMGVAPSAGFFASLGAVLLSKSEAATLPMVSVGSLGALAFCPLTRLLILHKLIISLRSRLWAESPLLRDAPVDYLCNLP